MELAELEPSLNWDGVVERLLLVANEELGTRVTLETGPPQASRGGGPDVAIPVTGKDGRRYGSLRISGESLSPREESMARVLARLVGERFDSREFVCAVWDRRVERVKRVLDSGELDVAYQPVVNLRSGQVQGVEALSRFPGQPPVGPDRWFRDAASVGLGVDLELLAVRRALTAFESLPAEQYLSLNVSPAVVLSPTLAREFEGLPLDRVVFEITEHAEVTDYAELNAALRRYRVRGLRLAVDDAGSGFASLRHILRIAPDIIKLDISLTRDIDRDAVLRALSYSLSSFASAIDATVVAEGVEREEELQALRFLGVTYGQGYYLRRPGPLATAQHLNVTFFSPSIAG